MQLDWVILNGIQNNLRVSFLDEIMPLITHLGDGGVLWIVLGAVLLLPVKTRRLGVLILLSLAIEALCCNVILKPLVDRARPFSLVPIEQMLIAAPLDPSFPSGHTGAAFAVVSALYFAKNKLWLPVGILAVLISFSRLYLYVHYPSDVFAGILLGIAAGYAGKKILNFWEKRKA